MEYTISKDKGLEFKLSVRMGMGIATMNLIRLKSVQGKQGFYDMQAKKKFKTIKEAAKWLSERY